MAWSSLCVVAPVVDSIQPGHASLTSGGQAIHIGFLRIPSAHGEYHAILHVIEHLLQGLGATAVPAIIDVRTVVFLDQRTLKRSIVAPVGWRQNVQSGQIDPLSTLQVKPCDAGILELCGHCEGLRGVDVKVAAKAMPSIVVGLSIV